MDKKSESREFGFSDTHAVHAGRFPLTTSVPSSPALYQASSYAFADLEQADAIYAGALPGSIYGRYGGPNSVHFETAVAELEGAEEAVGAASGMAAINAALSVSLAASVPVVCAHELYGGTFALLENDFQERGHWRVPVDVADLSSVAAALARTGSTVLYVEALSNPLLHIANLPELARVAHAYRARLIVDATFITPVLRRPLELGADLVVHSVGKYLGGHGDVGAGVVAGSAALCAPIRQWLIRNGAPIAHLEAWLAVRGMRTLGLRMTRHTANAVAVAAYLCTVPEVVRVHHPSLAQHPAYELAQQLYPAGTGGIVAFDLAGTRAGVEVFLRGLEMIAIVHSLGEVASTISYSAASSHRALPEAERVRQGVTDTTLRLSCGIEDARDIIADLTHAFSLFGTERPSAALA